MYDYNYSNILGLENSLYCFLSWVGLMGDGKEKGNSYSMIGFNQLPVFLQHSPNIMNFYRPSLSIKQTIISLFHYHNGRAGIVRAWSRNWWKWGSVETLNIWTHLLGSIMFGVLMVVSLATWLEDGDLLDKTVFLIFVLSAQILLFLSSFFHLFYCMSKCASEYSWFARLDYIGIAILICMWIVYLWCFDDCWLVVL